jgi:hypothetical protein
LLGWIEASPEKASSGQQVSPEVTASVVSWAIFGAGLNWSRNGAARSPDEVADQALSVILKGLQL